MSNTNETIDLQAKLAELEKKLNEGVLAKAKTAFEAKQKKYTYVIGFDVRRDTDPVAWHCDYVFICKCACGVEFRRQPCDVHTAQVNGVCVCEACRKAAKKSKRQESVKLEAEIAELKKRIAESTPAEVPAANQ